MQRVSLGTLSFSWLSESETLSILEEFFRCGGRLIDTAPIYGHGRAESLLGHFCRVHGVRASVTSKIGHFLMPTDFRSVRAFRCQLEKTAERLGHVPDALLLHEADWEAWWSDAPCESGSIWSSDALPRLQFDIYGEFSQLCQEFGCRHGLSGNNAEQLRLLVPLVRPHRVLVAKQLDVIWRNAAPLISLCKEENCEIACASPLHQGWLLKLDDLCVRRPELQHHTMELRALAEMCNVSVYELAIRFVRSKFPEIVVVLGADSASQLRTSIVTMKNPLPEDLLRRLDRIGGHYSPMLGPLKR